jgi:hypothetical protein
MTSTNGVSWTGVGGASYMNFCNTIAYGLDGSGNGLWVAGGNKYAKPPSNNFMSSSDLITWTNIGGSIFGQYPNKIVYANGIWVAVGWATNSFASSNDGITWTGRGFTPLEGQGYDVVYANNIWVAVGIGTSDSVASSTDGTTWTGRGGKTNFLSNNGGRAVAYGNGLWVVVGQGVITSPDLVTWTARSGVNFTALDVVYSSISNLWVTVGEAPSSSWATSTDGTTWTSKGNFSRSNEKLNTIAFNPDFSMVRTKPYVAQVLVFNRILTNDQRQQVESELYYKTGREYYLVPNNPYFAGPSQSIVIENVQNRLSVNYARAIAIGSNAGFTGQQYATISIGTNAGKLTQQVGGVAIGLSAGFNNQGQNAYAMGFSAGYNLQASGAMALGYMAGYDNQGTNAIAIGNSAGYSRQGSNALAIGYQSGYSAQRTNAIAIGYQAGYSAQGTNALSIGYQAGFSEQ